MSLAFSGFDDDMNWSPSKEEIKSHKRDIEIAEYIYEETIKRDKILTAIKAIKEYCKDKYKPIDQCQDTLYITIVAYLNKLEKELMERE